MAQKINTAYLGNTLDASADADKATMIKVDHVSMVFNIANQKLNSLKEYFIALMRHELRFKEFRALDDISFEVKKGDVFGILGTNGSGKSTMLKIVAGVLDPTEGTVEVNGKIAPLIELGAGFDMDLTARENVFLNGALLGYPKKFIEAHMDDIIAFAEIEKFMDMPLKNYSSGMIARIAFAIATVIVPEILIVDEVLSVGDFMFQQKCERRIVDIIKDNGVTVLIVSHNNDQIERLCNKAIWIEKSHTRMMGTAKEVCGAYRIVGGRPGTQESEAKVIAMMQQPEPAKDCYTSDLAGNDRYSTCVTMCEAYMYDKKHVIMCASDRFADAILGNSMAGAMDAILMNTGGDSLPGAIRQFLLRVNPSGVLMFGDTETVCAQAEEDIKKIGFNVQRLNEPDDTLRSIRAYEYVLNNGGAWGESAVLTYEGAMAGLLTMAPMAYELKAPIFYVSPDDSAANEQLVDILSRNFSNVFVVEQDFFIPQDVEEKLTEAGLNIERFRNEDACAISRQINLWMDKKAAADGLPMAGNIIASTAWEPVDAYFVGPYASATNSQILIYNPSNLDDTAAVFDFMATKSQSVKQICFLGGLSRFSEDDRKIMAKAICAIENGEYDSDTTAITAEVEA